MAVNGLAPFIKVTDSNGLPIVGAVLRVYDAGTTTYKSIYSDDGLATPLTNPLSGVNASNASGDFPRFYMAAGTYKLRAETAAGTLIWEFDNIDTGLGSGSGALPIASGGTASTTAAAARTALGVASQTEVDGLTSDIAALSSSLQNLVSVPQGRLTPTSGTPVLAADVSAGTAVYYTPHTGNQIPIWDGTQYNLSTFAELTLTMNAAHTANSIYDVWIWKESGVVTIGTGPVWNTVTAGAGARGTGAGTSERERKNGLWTNKVSMTTRNGATTYTVAANLATYVGSIHMDGTNGQITCHITAGQSRKWSVWNEFNKSPIRLKVTDSTAAWDYRTATIRVARGQTITNLATAFTGSPDEPFTITNNVTVSITLDASGTASGSASVGIGWNSPTAYSGKTGNASASKVIDGSFTFCPVGSYQNVPAIGIHNIYPLERGAATAQVCNFGGTETGLLLVVEYWG